MLCREGVELAFSYQQTYCRREQELILLNDSHTVGSMFVDMKKPAQRLLDRAWRYGYIDKAILRITTKPQAKRAISEALNSSILSARLEAAEFILAHADDFPGDIEPALRVVEEGLASTKGWLRLRATAAFLGYPKYSEHQALLDLAI